MTVYTSAMHYRADKHVIRHLEHAYCVEFDFIVVVKSYCQATKFNPLPGILWPHPKPLGWLSDLFNIKHYAYQDTSSCPKGVWNTLDPSCNKYCDLIG